MDRAIKNMCDSYIKKLLINLFKISNVNHSVEYAIFNIILDEFLTYGIGCYANYIYKVLRKRVNKKTFYAILNKLAKAGVIKKEKRDGLVFVEFAPAHKNALINLMSKGRNSNSVDIYDIEEDKFKKPADVYEYAREIFKDKIELSEDDFIVLEKLFNIYMEKTNEYFLFFKKKGEVLEYDEIKEFGDIFEISNKLKDKVLMVNYNTRFDFIEKYKMKVKEIIKKATEHYNYAFFITLTLKRDKKLLETPKLIREAWDKLRAYFRKIDDSIAFLKIHEFHKSGYPHLHILVFSNGRWLISQRKLSYLWDKYKMGRIVYIYLLKKHNDTYIWYRAKPKDALCKDISGYLSKYLTKMDERDMGLFWLTRLRFFTYSFRKLSIKKEVKVKKGWEFIGCLNVDDTVDKIIGLMIYKGLIKRNRNNKRSSIEWGYNRSKGCKVGYIVSKGWITDLCYMVRLWIG